MVYLEPGIVGLSPLTECWLRRLPSTLQRHISVFQHLFNTFLEASILFVRSSVHEALTSVDSNLVCSLLHLLDCFIAPFVPIQGERPLTKERLDRLRELLEPWFLFSLVWSVGATADGPSRAVFSRWLHNKIADSKVVFPRFLFDSCITLNNFIKLMTSLFPFSSSLSMTLQMTNVAVPCNPRFVAFVILRVFIKTNS
uniref:Dynein heavy chain AAA 5 extension domain-containing protein n=1 Tax=Eptatretus burgeri TaxID=7764 RepID=A0A8C4NH60_EPTBU